jgi:hypothetical protein
MRRAMRGLRAALWVVKGGLLIVCVLTLVMWVVSDRWFDERGYRWVEPDRDGSISHNELGLQGKGGTIWAYSIRRSYEGVDAAERLKRDVERRPWPRELGFRSHLWPDFVEHLGWFRDTAKFGPVGWGEERSGRSVARHLRIRHWTLALLYGAWPATSMAMGVGRAWRRRRRHLLGCCAACGYDLRATRERAAALLSRCPECGLERGGGSAVVQTPRHKGLARLSGFAKAFCVVLAVALVALWARSLSHADSLMRVRAAEPRTWTTVESSGMQCWKGWLYCLASETSYPGANGAQKVQDRLGEMRREPGWRLGSYEPFSQEAFEGDNGWGPVRWRAWGYFYEDRLTQAGYFRVPVLLLAALCGAWPITSMMRVRWRRLRGSSQS